MPLFGLLPLAAAHLQLAANKTLGIPEARIPSTVTEMLLGFVGLLLRPLVLAPQQESFDRRAFGHAAPAAGRG